MNSFLPMDLDDQLENLIRAVMEDDSLTEAEKEAEVERIKNSKSLMKDTLRW